MPTIDKKIENIIRPDILALKAYAIADPGEMTKLDAMENPYSWPAQLVEKWQNELGTAALNRYPDPNATALRKRLRSNMSVPESMDIMLGNGSDEIIQIILMAASKPGASVLSLQPSFVMYDMISTFAGMNFVSVPLNDNFGLDIDATCLAIEQHKPAVTFIAYPNNPTGNLFDRQHMEKIISSSPGLVVVDEAYHAFSEASFMQDLDDHDNLLVMRTVSKMGLAGLRLGLVAGHEKWLMEFNKIRLPYNINVLTQMSADFALRHYDVFAEQTAAICRDRDNMLKSLENMDKVSAYPSSANFILFRVPSGSSTRVFNELKAHSVLIKNLGASQGALQDCLRVTIGTPEENRLFLQALADILQDHP